MKRKHPSEAYGPHPHFRARQHYFNAWESSPSHLEHQQALLYTVHEFKQKHVKGMAFEVPQYYKAGINQLAETVHQTGAYTTIEKCQFCGQMECIKHGVQVAFGENSMGIPEGLRLYIGGTCLDNLLEAKAKRDVSPNWTGIGIAKQKELFTFRQEQMQEFERIRDTLKSTHGHYHTSRNEPAWQALKGALYGDAVLKPSDIMKAYAGWLQSDMVFARRDGKQIPLITNYARPTQQLRALIKKLSGKSPACGVLRAFTGVTKSGARVNSKVVATANPDLLQGTIELVTELQAINQ